MLRGVNKNIIEITDTGNEHFERAILFVRPKAREQDGDTLLMRARDYLAGLRMRRGMLGMHRGTAFAVVKYGSALAAGAGIAALLLLRL